MKKQSLPVITSSAMVAESRLFKVEQLDLAFSNGEKRVYERLKGNGRGAVMVIPLIDPQTMLLVREYAAGTHSYQLGFPKGLIDPGESSKEAANRELMEEVGYGADKLTSLYTLGLAPSYFNAQMDVFVAENLFAKSLPGDEPEPLEIVEWPVMAYESLLAQPDFTEARSVAALLLLNKHLSERG